MKPIKNRNYLVVLVVIDGSKWCVIGSSPSLDTAENIDSAVRKSGMA